MPREKTKEELEKEQKYKSLSYERKLKNKNNKFIIISVFIIALGYLFFLFSAKMFHEKPERFFTELGTNVAFTGGSVTPNSWIFSEGQNMMQVEFTFKSNQVITPEIEVNAATSYTDRTKSSSKLEAEVIYHENEFYIANIYNVPDDYYCVSLRIKTVESIKPTVNNQDGLGNQVIKEISETEGATEDGKEITSTAVMYTCRDSIDTTHYLYPLDDYIYKIKRIQSNINLDYAGINENNTAIESLKGANSELEFKNDELSNEMLYMTSSEKQVNEREIESNNSKINENISKINTLESNNLALQTEIQEYAEIIKRIAAENEGREYIAPTQDIQPTEQATDSENIAIQTNKK